ncbi:cytochrome c biogenesis CcdA family protein [Natrarchaeobius oligotrophus]|uniref:Cytochrome C biogenesis protein n=1 Tax=Natrarchaeobius chitinivorans TaxID=1679083 RepID=A0A3N6PJA6_NATCH|nr:cytochrome c biogenesis protein CcdA [Natrarchaeobius chitinivorans]RQG98555.1 cytochrome C biogenesis protein [Natrarchaeobius chitinivorans]
MVLPELRLWFAFTAGAMTFFAPCAYPMLPGYVAYYLGDDVGATRRGTLGQAATVSLVASLGMFAVYLGLVGIAVSVGAHYLERLVLLGAGVGLALIVLGIATFGGVAKGRTFTIALPERERSYRGYFGFGVAYAVASTGCTAPLFVAVVLSSLTVGAAAALVTVATYAGGMAAMLVVVTLVTAVGRDSILRRVVPRGPLLQRAAGALLVVAGVAQLYLFLFPYGGLGQLGIG